MNTVGEVFIYLLTLAIMGVFHVGITITFTGWGMTPLWSKTLATCFGFAGNFLSRKHLGLPGEEY